MPKRQGRGRPSSIDLLPEDVRVALNAALRDKSLTQQDIVEHFNVLLAERGCKAISKSSLNRYAMVVEERGAQLREAREAAQAIVGRLEDAGQTDVGRAVTEMVKSLAFDLVARRQDEDEPVSVEMIKDLSLACQRMEKASKLGADRELKIAEAAREEERQRLAEAVDEVADQALEGRLSPAQVLDKIKTFYRGEA